MGPSQQATFKTALNTALRYLGYRARTEAEVRRRLQNHFPQSLIEQVMGHLHKLQLLGDREFARMWVEDRLTRSPRGRLLLRKELLTKGIGRETIDEVLTFADEEASAYQAGRHKLRTAAASTFQEFQKKLGPFLRRRGFSFEVIDPVLQRLWEERSEQT